VAAQLVSALVITRLDYGNGTLLTLIDRWTVTVKPCAATASFERSSAPGL